MICKLWIERNCCNLLTESLPTGAIPPSPHCDPATQFQCSSEPDKCIQMSQVCDFISQCVDGSDEAECGILYFRFYLITVITVTPHDPPENCHLNVKKLPKTWLFFNCQNLSFFSIFRRVSLPQYIIRTYFLFVEHLFQIHNLLQKESYQQKYIHAYIE